MSCSDGYRHCLDKMKPMFSWSEWSRVLCDPQVRSLLGHFQNTSRYSKKLISRFFPLRCKPLTCLDQEQDHSRVSVYSMERQQHPQGVTGIWGAWMRCLERPVCCPEIIGGIYSSYITVTVPKWSIWSLMGWIGIIEVSEKFLKNLRRKMPHIP